MSVILSRWRGVSIGKRFVHRGIFDLSYLTEQPFCGRHIRISFQLGIGRGFAVSPDLSTTLCWKPRANMAVMSLSSTLASRVPRQRVLPKKEGQKRRIYTQE